MLLKYYLPTHGAPLLLPLLYYTLAANMKSHNGKKIWNYII